MFSAGSGAVARLGSAGWPLRTLQGASVMKGGSSVSTWCFNSGPESVSTAGSAGNGKRWISRMNITKSYVSITCMFRSYVTEKWTEEKLGKKNIYSVRNKNINGKKYSDIVSYARGGRGKSKVNGNKEIYGGNPQNDGGLESHLTFGWHDNLKEELHEDDFLHCTETNTRKN